ncbi:Dyp-type peroxidase [Taibaiella soli]|uniref:Dyp-type peroxidase C-terminal domain-containing protein n=1 Tax=Taibaiella soli TaxID=1649169 RepID=A0A2W2BXP1_9BACT|nr:Dyp-type peroxidase domain-containing protein [Taibaiella soli]PZF72623.1 hypothetical protein DN068_12215 [Taibaiella soli]
MIPDNDITVELDDVQGYLLYAYKNMKASRMLLLNFPSSREYAYGWLKTVYPQLTSAGLENRGIHRCLNIAFTPWGLKSLGLSDDNMKNFNREFREGIFTPHRQRLLGDEDESAPGKWRWGSPETNDKDPMESERVGHALLMVFGETEEILNGYLAELNRNLVQFELKEVAVLDGYSLPHNREHFGFRDGISQPVIAGSGRPGDPSNTIATGEFILGYKNEYGVYPETPIITTPQGNMNLLPADAAGSGCKDLGRNGTFLVYRQLEQHVDRFWKFIDEKSILDKGTDEERRNRLAAKMMGRWPSGASLIEYPDNDPGNSYSEKVMLDDKISYAGDPDGLKCPYGSHVRRANPRDHFEDNTPERSIQLTKKHRIVRRARPYVIENPEEHGLHFMCFNADISRQFEFIQYTWCNYPNDGQLCSDPDPIIGVKHEDKDRVFTIPGEPVGTQIEGLERFVTVKGAGYFFFPSLTAVRYLATVGDDGYCSK